MTPPDIELRLKHLSTIFDQTATSNFQYAEKLSVFLAFFIARQQAIFYIIDKMAISLSFCGE